MLTSYLHTQTTPASTWAVAHHAGAKVVSDVWIDGGGVRTKVLPLSVVAVDDDNLQVNFTAAQTGQVRVLLGVPYLSAASWVPDDVTPQLTADTLYDDTANNNPLQLENGQYLEVDAA